MNMNMQQMLKQLQNNPGEFFKQAMVMHLINSGKVSNPVLNMVMPMIRQMTGK